MSNATTVSKNTAFLLGGYSISFALRLVYVGALARYIGATGFGQIATATALVSLVILLVNFGLDTLIVRDVAGSQGKASKYFTHIAFLRFLLSLVFAILLAIVASLSNYPYETRVIIALFGLTYVIDAFSSIARSIFNAFQRMEFSSATDLARDLINIGFSLLGIWLGWSLVAIVAVSAGASLIKLIISLVVMFRWFVRPRFQIDLPLCGQLFSAAIPFAVLIVISIASTQMITVILSWEVTAEDVGIFAAAAMPVSMLMMLPNIFMESILPAFSDHYQNSAASLARSYSYCFKAMLIVGFPLGAGTILVSEPVIRLIFGPGFDKATIVMDIMAIQLMTMVGYVNGAFLNATNRQRLFAILRAAMTVLSLILCAILIPIFNYVGAALAVTIPALIDFGLYSVLCHRYAGLSLPWSTVGRIGLATIIMGGSGYLALHAGMNVIAVVFPLALALYVAALALLKVISSEEQQFLRKIVPFSWLHRVLQATGYE
jgi:O-antigen/teichoic acid export membrane protein